MAFTPFPSSVGWDKIQTHGHSIVNLVCYPLDQAFDYFGIRLNAGRSRIIFIIIIFYFSTSVSFHYDDLSFLIFVVIKNYQLKIFWDLSKLSLNHQIYKSLNNSYCYNVCRLVLSLFSFDYNNYLYSIAVLFYYQYIC